MRDFLDRVGRWLPARVKRVAQWARRALRGIPTWIGLIKVPFSVFVLVLLVVGVAAPSVRWMPAVLVGFVALMIAASWLGQQTRRHQDSHIGRSLGGTRVVLSLGLLVLGITLVLLRWPAPAFLVGLSFVTMASAALVSEIRRTKRWRSHYAVGLLVLGLGSLVAAALVPADGRAAILLLAGLLITVLATEVLSQLVEYYERDNDRPLLARWVAVTSGLGLVVLAMLLFVVTPGNMQFLHALAAVSVLLALVWMAASDSDALPLVVLFAFALIWASRPGSPDLSPRLEARSGERYFLVLGDSYISGEGAVEFLDGTNSVRPNEDHDNECRRAPSAWPVGLAEAQPADVPGRLLFLGCSGADTENVDTSRRAGVGGPAELDQYLEELNALGQDPEFAILGLGGNDAGFSRIGATCVAPGDCSALADQFFGPDSAVSDEPPSEVGPEALRNITDDLDAAYARVEDVLGDIPVITVPYPKPIGTKENCDQVLFDGSERAFLTKYVDQLNEIVHAAADRHGFLYMGRMEQSLELYGTTLCDASGLDSGLNFIAFNPKEGGDRDLLSPQNWTHNSIHPNARGHEAMLNAAITWFRENDPLPSTEPDPSATHVVPPLEELYAEEGELPELCRPASSEECSLSGFGWVKSQAQRAYRGWLLPVLIAMAGWWLVLVWLRRWARERNLSLMKVITCPLRRSPGSSQDTP
ncbi:MAG TPA: GDSL-type esterase/lipase family protein [Actinomycetota bacterium]|nr:GDSL-type esterase/lipase family protein [Actinomycetota bacterium]